MARTVVGLFNSTTEAQQALDQLLASGFARTSLHLATAATLQAAHLPAAEAAEAEAAEHPVEPMGTGFIRFFTDLFADHENADAAQTHTAATHADSAVITVRAATEADADRARQTLARHGAVDVYKQAIPQANSPADDVVDLEGSLHRVRDRDELDANGLTTH